MISTNAGREQAGFIDECWVELRMHVIPKGRRRPRLCLATWFNSVADPSVDIVKARIRKPANSVFVLPKDPSG